MLKYDEQAAAKKIQRKALFITSAFYSIVFMLLLLNLRGELVDWIPKFMVDWMDSLFYQNTQDALPAKPQAYL